MFSSQQNKIGHLRVKQKKKILPAKCLIENLDLGTLCA